MALFSCSGSSVNTNKTNIITYVFSIHLYDFKYAAITVLEYDENFILLYNNSLESAALYLTY